MTEFRKRFILQTESEGNMKDIKQCHPQLQKLSGDLIDNGKKQGLIIKIGDCFRTVGEQDALYAQGRTKAGSIVTNAKGIDYSSMHQWGIAFDFFRGDGSGAFDDTGNFFTKVGELGKKSGLEWGGDWKSPVDKPHLQLADWGSTPSKLKSLYGSPDKFMLTWVAGVEEQPLEKPDKTITEQSNEKSVTWFQIKANLVLKRIVLTDELGTRISLLTVDGKYGTKSKTFTRSYWKLLGWKNDDSVGNAGLKTIDALDIWK